jgi:hypothetical protein
MKRRREQTSLRIGATTSAVLFVARSSIASKSSRASSMGSSSTSEIRFPPTVTARLSGRRRAPPQASQGEATM